MTDPNFEIEAQRLSLTFFDPSNDSHCDFLVELYNAPEILATNGGIAPPIGDREAARKILTGEQDERLRSGDMYGKYLVTLKSPPPSDNDTPSLALHQYGEKIGIVTLNLRKGQNSFTVPEIGYWFLKKGRGRGYATEATGALMKYLEEEKGQRELFGFCNPDNKASKGVLKRLGFEARGIATLKTFGGIVGAVWARPGMNEDLSVYGV
ncbi:including n-acetylases of ribosomal protein [Lindgomyces ingoldianus]|uniref:Including n-acetylases of ribosomal protein n=1 Tax=Lindgomyces ingoldianus TaxID=673940 RepID=A0ACB6QQT5_9PLEO|nr:including n-acetylases of ribosomal protein [Lindgomyces ingoldianus]KAF2469245.1 including n-acetylases of ribosomal protein [Lindgomyces ingoldianus]